jgi:hypothetical protein
MASLTVSGRRSWRVEVEFTAACPASAVVMREAL